MVQKAVFVLNHVEKAFFFRAWLPDSYFEQRTEVDKPSLEENWIGFFSHFACQFIWAVACSMWHGLRKWRNCLVSNKAEGRKAINIEPWTDMWKTRIEQEIRTFSVTHGSMSKLLRKAVLDSPKRLISFYDFLSHVIIFSCYFCA